MKKLKSLYLLATFFFVGCSNTDGLREDVESLQRRVSSLETQVRDINRNIEGIAELLKTGIFITGTAQQAGVCTLTLSNGKTISLYTKTETNLLCPLIGIDKDGYWTVCYDTQTGFKQLLVDGNPIKAKGEDGKTPEFSIDSDGYWQVRYTPKEPFRFVYREGTQEKVSATSGATAVADSFFERVEVTDSELLLTLKGESDSSVIRIPVVSDFELSFPATVQNTLQEFAPGETKNFAMTARGVEHLLISTPQGWTASFENSTLTVTAPSVSKTSTRATANSESEVALLATRGKYALIAKIQVGVGEALPDNKSLFESGKLKIGEETLDTQAYTSQSLDGQGEKNLSTLLGSTTSSILFLSGTEEFHISSATTVTASMAIVGQTPGQRPTLVFDEKAYLALKSGKLLLKNIHVKARADNYLFNSPTTGDASFTHLTIDDCKVTNLTKAMYYVSKTTVGIGCIRMQNSVFEFVNDKNIAFFNISSTEKPGLFRELYVENNVVYHKTGVAPIQLFNWNTKTQTTDTEIMTVKIKNNSFLNLKGANALTKANRVTLHYTDNLFYVAADNTQTSYLYELKDNASTVETTGNVVFDAQGSWLYTNGTVSKPTNNLMDKTDTSPFSKTNFADGVFEKTSAYADKGANQNL